MPRLARGIGCERQHLRRLLLLSPHVKRVLSHMNLREGATISEISQRAWHPALAPPLWGRCNRGCGGCRRHGLLGWRVEVLGLGQEKGSHGGAAPQSSWGADESWSPRGGNHGERRRKGAGCLRRREGGEKRRKPGVTRTLTAKKTRPAIKAAVRDELLALESVVMRPMAAAAAGSRSGEEWCLGDLADSKQASKQYF